MVLHLKRGWQGAYVDLVAAGWRWGWVGWLCFAALPPGRTRLRPPILPSGSEQTTRWPTIIPTFLPTHHICPPHNQAVLTLSQKYQKISKVIRGSVCVGEWVLKQLFKERRNQGRRPSLAPHALGIKQLKAAQILICLKNTPKATTFLLPIDWPFLSNLCAGFDITSNRYT